jgi:signal transduction histidine kinase
MQRFQLKPAILFYLMIAYIIASYSWWTVLLLSKNTEAFQHRTQNIRQVLERDGMTSEETLVNSTAYQKALCDYEAQRMMVLGESAVFLLLVVIIGWQLLRSFNKEIELNRSQKNFLLSITHELRSPIASAKLAMQTLERKHDLPIEKTSRLVGNALSDIDRLHGLVENLLLSAKIESAAFHAGTDAVDLSALLRDAASRLQDTVGRGREFELDVQPGIRVAGDSNALVSVVYNLIENAIKYSPADSPLHIRLSGENGEAVLTVADQGYGVPEAERRKIFRKFYRVGNEDTRRSKGTGLGLYIVERIVALHGGKIQVKDNAPRGTVFEIKFPKLASTV